MNAERALIILKKQSFAILISLGIQYVLGMIINMFAAPPDDPAFKTESPLLKIAFGIHGLNGLILPVFALGIIFFALKTKNELFEKIAIYGFISILVAAVSGISTIILKDNASELASFV